MMPRMPNETEEEYELRKQRMRAQAIRQQQQGQQQAMQAGMQAAQNYMGDAGGSGGGPGLGTYAQLAAGVLALDKVGDDLGVGCNDQKRAYKKIGGKMKDWFDPREWF